MGSVGYLLYHWSLLEEQIVDEIRELRAKGGDGGKPLVRIRGSSSERLAEWRALLSSEARRYPVIAAAVAELASDIERLRRDRNLVGQQFVSVVDGGPDAEPMIRCGNAYGGTGLRGFTRHQLREIIAGVEECRQRLVTLGENARKHRRGRHAPHCQFCMQEFASELELS